MKESNLSSLVSLQGSDSYLLMTKPSDYVKSRDFVAGAINKLGIKSIYVSLDNSHDELINSFNPGKVLFVDASGNKCTSKKGLVKCVNVNAKHSFTELSIQLTDLINSGVFDCLIFDSVSSLLPNHSSDLTKRFIEFLVKKINYSFMKCIFILNQDASKEQASNLCSLFDKCIIA